MSVCDVNLDRDEMTALLARIAGQSGSVEERMARVARKLGWNFRRVKSHWYGEARRIDAEEIRSAREAARRAEEATANAEIAELRLRLARLEALLADSHPLAFSQAVDAIRHP